MPRASAATSTASRPTRGSFSSVWKSRPPNGSTAFRRPSPSRTKTPAAPAARPSAPPPKPATTCGCCSPKSARCFAGSAGRRFAAIRPQSAAELLAELPEGTRFLVAFAAEPNGGDARALGRLAGGGLRASDRRRPPGQPGRRARGRRSHAVGKPAPACCVVVDRLTAGSASRPAARFAGDGIRQGARAAPSCWSRHRDGAAPLAGGRAA